MFLFRQSVVSENLWEIELHKFQWDGSSISIYQNTLKTEHFQKLAIEATPRSQTEKEHQHSVRVYLSEKALNHRLENEDWRGVVQQLRLEFEKGQRQLDANNFELLVEAESRIENWSGILSAYALLNARDPGRAGSQQALIRQAQAAEKLGDRERATYFYSAVLELNTVTEEEQTKQEQGKENVS